MAGDAAPVFVLIHSPLVGPSTWTPVARELERRGRQVVVPSLLGAATEPPPQWRYCIDAVRAATSTLANQIVLVGHSGGGLLLPAIRGAVTTAVSRLIFVDSGVPASSGEIPLVPPPLLAHLRTLAVDGTLPPWSAWWGDEAMRELVPDQAARAALERELPSLPLSYFEESVPSPAGWDRVPCAYLLLSDAYRDAASDARAREWPVEEITGAQHLHLVVAPATVADVLIQLAD